MDHQGVVRWYDKYHMIRTVNLMYSNRRKSLDKSKITNTLWAIDALLVHLKIGRVGFVLFGYGRIWP